MGHSEQADYLRKEFVSTLRKMGGQVEDMRSLALVYDDNILKAIFERWSNLGREIFAIKGVGFVNVHIRSESPGFWGITKQVEKDFKNISKNLGVPCFYVLLVGGNSGGQLNGYILKEIFEKPVIGTPGMQENSYKINEIDLDPTTKIFGKNNIAEKLISIGKNSRKQSTKTVIKRTKVQYLNKADG